ncbi:hypothetical protein DUNSADRAFT_11088 [Dunaliella salina]|uniref:Uncharacterized protein n=1 Tax=Dunaliella salina TaxID=3046 RepID=A0ABQ7GE37_DUNSA|nr:hypothetical protein DUNSADRAFT_11088 [Dunaliella salina]|eukprot:KAF5832868.1 hypothetical protein DUNSADRAFT_11088 [Dunaliella salina]
MGDVYLDEEDCLGAELFASELELLVGSIKLRGRLDQVQLLELLPKLAATIPKADRASLKGLQKKCEPALTEMIGMGVCTTVRRLIAVCLTRFYMFGDVIGIYSRVHSLQTALNAREQGSKGNSTWQMLLGAGSVGSGEKSGAGDGAGLNDGVRAGMLDLLAHLSLHHGRFLASAAATNLVISKNGSKSSSRAVRVAAVRLAAATVEGLHPRDRAVPEVQAEAYALFRQSAKEQGCVDTQAAGAALISAIARGGGSALWRDGCFYWEEALRLCSAHLSHPNQAVRDGYALALCDLTVAVSHEVLDDAINAEKRAAKKAALDRLKAGARGEVLQRALVQPLVLAALRGAGASCASLSLAWTSYVGWVAAKEGDSVLVEVAVQVVQLCDAAAAAKAQSDARALAGVPPEVHLGEAYASGELPHIQACALYILRSAVIEALTESSQKALLHQLVGLLVRPGCAVPTAVVALEGLSILMDVLGEVGEEEGGTLLEAAVMSQVAAHLPLSVPTILPRRAYALASQLIRQPNSRGSVTRCSEREAGYILLGALICSWEGAGEEAAGYLGSTPAIRSQIRPNLPIRDSSSGKQGSLARGSVGGAWKEGVSMGGGEGESRAANGTATECTIRDAPPEGEPAGGSLARGSIGGAWKAGGHSEIEEEDGPAGAAAGLDSTIRENGSTRGDSLARGSIGGAWKAGSHTSEIEEEPVGSGVGAAQTTRPNGTAQEASLARDSIGGPWRTAKSTEADDVAQGEQAEDAMLGLLAVAAGNAAREELGESGYAKPGSDAHLSMQLRWRAVALQALHAYMAALLAKGQHASTSTQMRHISTYLSQLLAVVESQRLCSHPVRLATIAMCGSLSAAEAALPQPSLLGLQTGAMEVLHQAVLRHVLEKEDDVLGPWLLGRDMAEDELHAFAGEQGGPHQLPWELPLLQALYSDSRGRGGEAPRPGSSSSVPQGFLWMAAPRAASSHHHHTNANKDASGIIRGTLYPQPIGLGPALLTAQVAVLGQLLSQVSKDIQLNILDLVWQPPSVHIKFFSNHHACRLGAGTLAAIVALSGLMPLVRQPPSVRASIMGTAETADKVVSALSDEVTGSVADGRDKQRRSALCLALSCVHRAKGGLVLQALIPSSTAAFVAAARHPAGSDIALLECLQFGVLAADGFPALAPLSVLDHHNNTYTLAFLQHLHPHMTCVYLLYAVQAGVLAVDDPPALAALCAAGSSGKGSGAAPSQHDTSTLYAAPRPITVEALACELQAVLFAQQLILFAPKAIQASKHVPMLQVCDAVRSKC